MVFFYVQHHITIYLRSLRTPLYWVQAPPPKKGSGGLGSKASEIRNRYTKDSLLTSPWPPAVVRRKKSLLNCLIKLTIIKIGGKHDRLCEKYKETHWP